VRRRKRVVLSRLALSLCDARAAPVVVAWWCRALKSIDRPMGVRVCLWSVSGFCGVARESEVSLFGVEGEEREGGGEDQRRKGDPSLLLVDVSIPTNTQLRRLRTLVLAIPHRQF
jgi:hypothetical protein